MKTLVESDFERAAKLLKVDVATIKAVAEVESRGKGFYADGFPVILFERHKFRKFTNGKYDGSHPHLSNKTAGGYRESSRKKFNEAFKLNPDAAMKSCSWGKFQIMGFNHKDCGYETVGEFVDAMKESEGKHLDAFCLFVKANNLAQALWSKDWARFARGYNGEDYKKNRYDEKLAEAYEKYARAYLKRSQIVDSINELPPPHWPIGVIPNQIIPVRVEPDQRLTDLVLEDGTILNQIEDIGNVPDERGVEYISPVSKSSVGVAIGLAAVGAGAWFKAFVSENLIWIVAGVVVIAIAALYWSAAKKRSSDRTIALNGISPTTGNTDT